MRNLEADIEAIRFDAGDGARIELPVKLKVHDSIFVSLAKWRLLLAGNYRCVQKDGMRSIKDAVHDDLDTTVALVDGWLDINRRKRNADGTYEAKSVSGTANFPFLEN